jgi:hypothetical protein
MKTIKWFTFAVCVVLLSCDGDSDIPDDCVDPSQKIEGECSKIFAPVCGCNNITYNNDCVARTEGVQQWTTGECK